MIEAQRRAYLDAMGISVWLCKPVAADLDRLVIGPGSGSTLLLCRDAGESASQVSADICRYLADGPAWAWPDPAASAQLPSLKETIAQGLFTRVLIFGQALGSQLLNSRVPEIIGSARILVAPDLDQLAASAHARQDLWLLLSDKQPASEP
jgi:hypothetical protein